MAQIDVICPITRNSAPYAEYFRRIAELMKSKKHTLKWRYVESVGANGLPANFEKAGKTGEFGQNSLNHAMALHRAMKVASSPYVIFADADIVITYKNWDDVVVKTLDKGNDCFGFAWGKDENRRYHNFPNVLFFAFKKELLQKVELDFRPKVRGEKVQKHAINKEEARFMNRRTKDIVKCDTGWLLPVTLGRANCNGIPIPMVRGGSKKSKMPFRNTKQRSIFKERPTHMTEYHWEEDLFGSHLQASRNIPFNSTYSKVWRQRIHDYVLKKNGISLEPDI